ncbi:MAG: type II secretion system protein [Candidatus Omnitrophica bacterium]|nr:type II secretion system protein [Candidatus Omnitrophota bacterium]
MRKSKGFTLLEIVIALAILAIGMVGILSLFPVGFQASRRASMLTEATIHAQQEIENFKLGGYSYLEATWPKADASKNGVAYSIDGAASGGWSDLGSDIKGQVTVTEINPPGNLKSVSLVIQWQEKGVYKSETFITYIAE